MYFYKEAYFYALAYFYILTAYTIYTLFNPQWSMWSLPLVGYLQSQYYYMHLTYSGYHLLCVSSPLYLHKNQNHTHFLNLVVHPNRLSLGHQISLHAEIHRLWHVDCIPNVQNACTIHWPPVPMHFILEVDRSTSVSSSLMNNSVYL